jgi:long-subunit fatty acid transport protein
MQRETRRTVRRVSLGAIVCAIAGYASSAAASGGYFAGTKGARSAGRAGAFVAKADDVTATVVNPAGLARLTGSMVQVGNRFSYNGVSYERATTLDHGNEQGGVAPEVSFDSVENEAPFQILDPLLGAATDFGLEDFGFALFAYAPPGASRMEFPVDGGQRYMMVNREAIILDYSASGAWKFRDLFGVGLTLSWIHVPRLTYSLVIDATVSPTDANPVSSELDMRATATGSDAMTLNAIVGAWLRPVPAIEIGLAAQVLPSEVVTDSTLEIEGLNPNLPSDVVLTRDGRPADDVSITLPLPMFVRAGVRYRGLDGVREVYDLELDLEYETWSRVEQFTLETRDLVGNLDGQFIPIGRIDIAKQWRDTLAIKLGGDYALMPDFLTVRAGVYYETAVAKPAYAHVDFPSGTQIGGALGGSLFLGNLELALAYEARVQPTVSVSEEDARVYQETPASPCQPPYTDPDTCNENYLGQPSPAVNAGKYFAQSHMVSVEGIYRF